MGKDMCFNEAAQAMEAKMVAFYADMAKWVQNKKAKELLQYLAGEESAHLEDLERWGCSEVNTDVLNRAYRDAGEIMEFLKMELMNRVTLSLKLEDEIQVIDLALDAEADMLRFYTVLLPHVDDVSLARDVEAMMKAEESHIEKLRVVRNVIAQEKARQTPSIDDMRKST